MGSISDNVDVFRIAETNQSYKLEIRWNGEYAATTIESLADQICPLIGVESVKCYRYTMAVYFATHVVEASALAASIRQTLKLYIAQWPSQIA